MPNLSPWYDQFAASGFNSVQIAQPSYSHVNSIPLRLAVAYETNERPNITACAFSKCGLYFAFVESPCVVAVYPTHGLFEAAFRVPSIPVDVDSTGSAPATVIDQPWRTLTSELLSGDGAAFKYNPLRRILANGVVQCITFAEGDISACRLPHRTRKRRSVVIQGSTVSLILLGLITGYTEVYNLFDLSAAISRIPNLILFDDNLSVFGLYVCPDKSLRVASVHLGGEVKLWDLWDDGNMYASLKRHFQFPVEDETGRNMISGEACTFAWQPLGLHVCMAGQRGYGVILRSEKPFRHFGTLRSGHYHRISAASYTQDGSLLLTASYDSSCVVWSVPEYTPLHHYWHMGRVPSLLLLGGANGHHMYGLAVAPDDLHFATICEDRCVRLWALHPNTSPEKTYYELALPTIPSVKLRSVAFSPCGKLLAVTSSDNRVLIFTTPSDSLSLSTQCTRVIRRCITRRLMEVYPTQTAALDARGSKFSISGLPNRLFCKAASYLPLPPHLILNLFREFGSHSQPYFHANMPSLV